jgi:dolichol kinase
VALSKEEISRKLLHLLALLMPIAIFYSPKWSIPTSVVTLTLCVLFFGSIIIEALRFRFPMIQKIFFSLFGSMLRNEEHFKITGSTWVIGAAFVCSILFCKYTHIAFMVLSLFIIGDAAAALVGIGIGRIKIGKKTLEGSCGCFLACLFLFYVCFPLLPDLLKPWGGRAPALIIWVTSLAITLFELIPLRLSRTIAINDNIGVPIIAGYIMLALQDVVVR